MRWKGLLNDEQGLELSEYAVMTALIVAFTVAVLTMLAGGIIGMLQRLIELLTQ